MWLLEQLVAHTLGLQQAKSQEVKQAAAEVQQQAQSQAVGQ